MRFSNLFFWALLLSVFLSFPILSFADEALINELTEILTLYEEGLYELQTGVAILRTGQKKLETGLIISQRELTRLKTAQIGLSRELIKSGELINDLESSLKIYEQRTEILVWVSGGLGVVAVTAVVIAIIQ